MPNYKNPRWLKYKREVLVNDTSFSNKKEKSIKRESERYLMSLKLAIY